MRDGRGSHFDPDVLDAFFAVEARFAEIAAQFSDGAAH
jgi:putative two-component system response regulator